MDKRPNFFIVGAPKCGTTTLYECLRQHSQIYMPYDARRYWLHKEPGFFCSELYQRAHIAVTNESAYRQLFAAAGHQSRLGEASALYLFSTEAAKRIQRFNPEAKIIIALREPVAMMRSWHADNLRHGHENVISFQRAVELEAVRLTGSCVPRGSGYPACLQYRAMAAFSEQVQRFQACFDRSQLKIILLEDWAEQPTQTLNSIVEFLGLEPEMTPTELVHNERIALSQGALLKHRVKNWLRGMSIVVAARRSLPFDLDGALEWGLRPFMKNAPVAAHDNQGFLAELREQFQPEIARLSKVIDRDLSRWLSTPPGCSCLPRPHFSQPTGRRGADDSPIQLAKPSTSDRPIGTIAKNG